MGKRFYIQQSRIAFQGNEDGDKFGDACDPCPFDKNATTCSAPALPRLASRPMSEARKLREARVFASQR